MSYNVGVGVWKKQDGVIVMSIEKVNHRDGGKDVFR